MDACTTAEPICSGGGGGGVPAVGCLYYSRANLPRHYLLDACTTAEPIKSDELQLGAMAALASLVVLGFRCWVLDACTIAHTGSAVVQASSMLC